MKYYEDEFQMDQTDEWLDYLRSMNRKENTLQTHRNNVRRCLEVLEGCGRPVRAEGITKEDILFLWRELPVKEEVRRAYLRSLAGMLVYHTGVDVVKNTNILHNREMRIRVFINDDEFRIVYMAANPFQRLILCLGAYMGLRRVEMNGIRDRDIRGNMMRVHGKGHGEEGLVAYLEIPAPVAKAISEYRRSEMKKGERSDDYLLQTRSHKGVLHRADASRISDSITALAKVTGVHVTTHSLRRYYATTLYYETECDLQTVRRLMRHADISTTLKCYVDAYDERAREASVKLTDYIDRLVTGTEP